MTLVVLFQGSLLAPVAPPVVPGFGGHVPGTEDVAGRIAAAADFHGRASGTGDVGDRVAQGGDQAGRATGARDQGGRGTGNV
jgi:hypothetical protein